MSTLFDELSEVDRADLLRTMSRLHAVLERRMAAAGLNPSGAPKGRAQKRLRGGRARVNQAAGMATLPVRNSLHAPGRQSVRRSGKPGAAGGPPVLLL